MNGDEILTVDDLAEAVPAFTRRFQQRLRSERRITYYRVGKKIVYTRRDVDRLLRANRIEAQ